MKITFFGGYLLEILRYDFINNNYLSVSCFIWEFSFRFNVKAPVDVSSSVRVIHGYPLIHALARMDECYSQSQRLASFLHLL